MDSTELRLCIGCPQRDPQAGPILPPPHPSLESHTQYYAICKTFLATRRSNGQLDRIIAPKFEPRQLRMHNTNHEVEHSPGKSLLHYKTSRNLDGVGELAKSMCLCSQAICLERETQVEPVGCTQVPVRTLQEFDKGFRPNTEVKVNPPEQLQAPVAEIYHSLREVTAPAYSSKCDYCEVTSSRTPDTRLSNSTEDNSKGSLNANACQPSAVPLPADSGGPDDCTLAPMWTPINRPTQIAEEAARKVRMESGRSGMGSSIHTTMQGESHGKINESSLRTLERRR